MGKLQQLVKTLPMVCFSPYKVSMYRAAFLIAWGGGLSPCLALQDYLVAQPQEHPVLFIHQNGSAFTWYQFTTMLQRAVQTTGVPPEYFTAHTFRIRAASMVAAAGLLSLDRCFIGCSKYEAFRSYIRLQPTGHGREATGPQGRWRRPLPH